MRVNEQDAWQERTEAFPPTSGCEPDDEPESMEGDNQRAEEQTAQERFDESVRREIRRLIAKGRESMEWPTEPCESMEFRDGLPPSYCCENCEEIDRRLERMEKKHEL